MSTVFQNVHVRVNDAATGKPTPVRIRFVGPDGTYYAPFGRLTEFGTGIAEDVGGNLQLGEKKYAYIDGTCEIRLPVGKVSVEIVKGLEYRPVSEEVELKQGKLSMRLQVERWIDLRAQGWYSGDSHCFALTPHGALLEGQAEDVAVANLLACPMDLPGYHNLCPQEKRQAGSSYPAITNILAFSGQVPALAGDGHLVVVNTLNRHPHLGTVALLNSHRAVYPLMLGEDGEPDEWNVADWCQQCHRKGGLVVAPYFPSDGTGQREIIADLILGLVDALAVNLRLTSRTMSLWEELLASGVCVPLVGGSDKFSNGDLLGRRRTYALLREDEAITYTHWIDAVRAGRTFVTSGPLLIFLVNSQPPGSIVKLPATGQAVRLQLTVKGLRPVATAEILHNGKVIATTHSTVSEGISSCNLELEVPMHESGWLWARCQGAFDEDALCDHAAISSAVQLQIEGKPPRVDPGAVERLQAQLNADLDWVNHHCRFDSDQQRQRMASVYRTAKQRLEDKLLGTGTS